MLLTIYNIRGEEVEVLIDGYQPEGNSSVTWDGSDFASGIYFYRLKLGDFVEARKMVLMK